LLSNCNGIMRSDLPNDIAAPCQGQLYRLPTSAATAAAAAAAAAADTLRPTATDCPNKALCERMRPRAAKTGQYQQQQQH